MRKNMLLTIVVVLSVAGFAGAQVPHVRHHAPNYIVPQSRAYSFAVSAAPRYARAPQRVQVTEVQVGVVILSQVATTTMDVSLYNPSRRRLEAQLLVPVPEGAMLKGFDFHGTAKEPTAKLLPKAEAKRTYHAIVARVRDRLRTSTPLASQVSLFHEMFSDQVAASVSPIGDAVDTPNRKR